MHPCMIKTSLFIIAALGIDRALAGPIQTHIKDQEPQLRSPKNFEGPVTAVKDVPPAPFPPLSPSDVPPPFVPIPMFPSSVIPAVFTTAPSRIKPDARIFGRGNP
ncbi:hypothetical protein V8F20_009317 [Naviculisporaceae sp. PSN 640]